MNQNDRLLAVLAHLLGIFTGFLGALVIYLIADRDNEYLRRNATEALNFQITVGIGYIISSILIVLLIGFIGWGIVYIANIVFCILGGITASRDEIYTYPMSIRLVK